MGYLFTEQTNEELEQYTKERCEEIKKMYDELSVSIWKISSETDELKKFKELSKVILLMSQISFEHVDTLDRYLHAYELNKRLENKITKLKRLAGFDEES